MTRFFEAKSKKLFQIPMNCTKLTDSIRIALQFLGNRYKICVSKGVKSIWRGDRAEKIEIITAGRTLFYNSIRKNIFVLLGQIKPRGADSISGGSLPSAFGIFENNFTEKENSTWRTGESTTRSIYYLLAR